VQGTVTRTELGQKWPTVQGQGDLLTFQGHAVSQVTSPVDRAYSLQLGWFPICHILTPTPYHAPFLKCCTSILQQTNTLPARK